LDIAEKENSRESVEHAKTLGSIGGSHLWTEEYEKSLQYFTNELQIHESILEK
jgi:hypothetical protein